MSDYEAALTKRYNKQVADIARGLRRLAEEVEREAEPRPNITHGSDKDPDYVYAAAQVVSAVTWGVANLHLSRLIDTAGEFHYARTLDGAA